MDRWQNKVAVVTGASSGIGAGVAEDLVKAGLIVVALARREERLRENQLKLPVSLQSNYHPIKCDVTREDDVKCAFGWVEKNLGGTDILVNNAGIARLGIQLIDENNAQAMRDVVDTNIMATVYCVREAFASMKNRNVAGHVVIVNSVLGHFMPVIKFANFNIYPATKYAITAMTETYRQEFANSGTKVKVTSISPGAVETEAITDIEKRKSAGMTFLTVEDVSNAILYAIGTPPNVQIHEITLRALENTDKK